MAEFALPFKPSSISCGRPFKLNVKEARVDVLKVRGR